MAELGPDYGCGLSQTELAYLAREEWARTAEDFCGGAASSGCI